MRLRRSFCRYFFAPARSNLRRVDYVGVASLPVLYMVDVVYALLVGYFLCCVSQTLEGSRPMHRRIWASAARLAWVLAIARCSACLGALMP